MRRNQRRHPVFVGKADPAIGGSVGFLTLRAFQRGQAGDVVIVDLDQFAIRAADHAFMQHEKVLQIGGSAVACRLSIGRKAGCGGAGIGHGIGHGEQILLVHRNFAAESQPLAVLPFQRHRFAW